MKNWDVFVLVFSFIITIMLFSSGKISYDNMLSDLNAISVLIVMLKTIGVMILVTTFLTLVILFLLADIIVSVVLTLEFPILHFLYYQVYLDIVRGWYWDFHSGSNIFMACIILFGLALVNSYLNPFGSGKTLVLQKR